jgi:hypothetical protein
LKAVPKLTQYYSDVQFEENWVYLLKYDLNTQGREGRQGYIQKIANGYRSVAGIAELQRLCPKQEFAIWWELCNTTALVKERTASATKATKTAKAAKAAKPGRKRAVPARTSDGQATTSQSKRVRGGTE